MDYQDTYDLIVANSRFTQRWIERFWTKPSEVLYPPVDLGEASAIGTKQRIILSVGRFFPGEHSKKQLEMVKAFAELCRGELTDWEYHLAGGVSADEADRDYFAQVQQAIGSNLVSLHPNIGRAELTDLYRRSGLFWHAAGFGEDEEADPENFEHFGIATVEAMSWGCVPLLFRGGGSVELVEQGKNGFLWRSFSDVKRLTLDLAGDPAVRERLARAAQRTSQAFGIAPFASRLEELVRRSVAGDRFVG